MGMRRVTARSYVFRSYPNTTYIVVSESSAFPEASFSWRSGTCTRLADRRPLPVYSRRLREAREACGISQRVLGIKAGLDEFVASARGNRYETGVHHPHLQTQQHLAKVLKLPLAYFYAEDDELARLIADFKRRSRPRHS